MKTRALIPFFIISFGLNWSLAGALLTFPAQIESVFGELSTKHPFFILAVYSPAIAAFTLVMWASGLGGLRRYLSRFLLWRAHRGWYAYILIGIPFLFYSGAALKGNLFTDPFPFTSIGATLSALAFMMVLGPMEEFGWRGVAQPLLQRKFAPFWAAIILGVIWGIWHLPAFFLSGTPQSNWDFMPFFTAAIALSVIVTPLFNSSGGSILLPALIHWQLNNPIFPDAAPNDTIMFAAAAVIVAVIHRKTMFDKASGVTVVIPEKASNDQTVDQNSTVVGRV